MRRGMCRGAVAWLVIPVIVAIGALCTSDVAAVRLHGTSSTAAYLQQVAKGGTGDDFENRTRLFERLSFRVDRLPVADLTFHAALTARNDLSNESLSDTKTRLYRGYLRYKWPCKLSKSIGFEGRLGRQWIASGVGSGTIDGLSLAMKQNRWGGLTLFAGTLGIDTRDQLRFDSPEDSRRLGAELRIRPSFREGYEPELAVSIADTRRDDEDESRRLGIRGSIFVRRQLRIWTQVRHDLHLGETYATSAGAEFHRRPSGLRAWVEFDDRLPRIPLTSRFWIFDQNRVSDLRGGLTIRVTGPYKAGFDFTRTDFKAGSSVDRSKSFRFVVIRDGVRIGAQFQSGYGGDRTRLVLAGSRAFGTRLLVSADLGYESYDRGPTDLEDNTASSGIVAVSYQAYRDTKITAQVENHSNRDLKSDLRLLARIDQRFRLGH